MPGLKGLSKTQLKRMKSFYLAWQNYFRTLSDFTNNSSITYFTNITVCEDIVIGPLTTDQFDKATLDAFLAVQFTHHYEILQRTNTLNERLFQVFFIFYPHTTLYFRQESFLFVRDMDGVKLRLPGV